MAYGSGNVSIDESLCSGISGMSPATIVGASKVLMACHTRDVSIMGVCGFGMAMAAQTGTRGGGVVPPSTFMGIQPSLRPYRLQEDRLGVLSRSRSPLVRLPNPGYGSPIWWAESHLENDGVEYWNRSIMPPFGGAVFSKGGERRVGTCGECSS